MEVAILGKNYRLSLAHIVPPFATRVSCVVVDVGVPGGELGNVQTGVGGYRVSSICLLGCSTSLALATGPTYEEEPIANFQYILVSY